MLVIDGAIYAFLSIKNTKSLHKSLYDMPEALSLVRFEPLWEGGGGHSVAEEQCGVGLYTYFVPQAAVDEALQCLAPSFDQQRADFLAMQVLHYLLGYVAGEVERHL